ncbi:MAG: 2'-deoxycytidine 5'-triphosphate deaminase [Mesorhizobium sp.]|nr:MAG: 2'-deoxycytidine 5'-triphosphate deaminase [Mesorhizobium sp.]
MRQTGILPDQDISALFQSGALKSPRGLDADQVQPASLDLRLGDKAWRVRASFLPGPNHRVAEKLDRLKLHEIDLADGAVLETGCVYIVPLLESLALPANVSASANPKSSTGRLDIFTGNALLSESELHELHRAETLVATEPPNISGGGIALSIDLDGDKDGLVGYRGKHHTGLVDVDKRAAQDVVDFWEPLYKSGAGELVLDPDEFYILVSQEAVHVPPLYAAEMTPFDPLVGEFRVHYAGFFDPGFGHSAAGGTGSRAVLEVRSHEVPFILDHGQIVGRLVYEHMLKRPQALYGTDLGSNYQAQGLKLSKHFRAAR